MTKDLFPSETKEEIKNKILSLAKTVYSKDVTELTKKEIESLVLMDIKSAINKVTVSVGGTRPTRVQYAGNNYHFSAEIDVSGMFEVLRTVVENTDQNQMLEKYFDMKAAVYNMIKVKINSTESYLHEIFDSALTKDGLAVVGRNAPKD